MTRGSSRLAMSAIGLPARLPAQPLRAAVPDWDPPSWMTSTHVSGLSSAFPVVFTFAIARLAASASSWNVRPATPVGVTIVGVDSSTSPRKPIVNFFPLSDLKRLVA